jgi:hypothetical protein
MNPLTALETYHGILESCAVTGPIHPYSAEALMRAVFGLLDRATAAAIVALPDSSLSVLSDCLLYGPSY